MTWLATELPLPRQEVSHDGGTRKQSSCQTFTVAATQRPSKAILLIRVEIQEPLLGLVEALWWVFFATTAAPASGKPPSTSGSSFSLTAAPNSTMSVSTSISVRSSELPRRHQGGHSRVVSAGRRSGWIAWINGCFQRSALLGCSALLRATFESKASPNPTLLLQCAAAGGAHQPRQLSVVQPRAMQS